MRVILCMKCPTSTIPGQILKNKTPCFLYCALNFAVIMFIAALLVAYIGETSRSSLLTKSMSPMPLDMTTIFLVLPARMSGMKRL